MQNVYCDTYNTQLFNASFLYSVCPILSQTASLMQGGVQATKNLMFGT